MSQKELTYKKLNKKPKSRKICFFLGNKKIASAEPCFGWYSCEKFDDINLNKEIRKIIIDNLYWLLGCDCDLDEWKDSVDSYNGKPKLYSPDAVNVTCLFFDNDEKDKAYYSFFNN